MTTLTTIIPAPETTTVPASKDGGKDLPAAINVADEPLSGAARSVPRVQPDWKHPGCCSKPGDCLCQIISVFFHPIFLSFFIIILLLDLIYRWISPCWRGSWSACLRRDWMADLLCFVASGLLGFSSIFAVGAVGHYPMALKFANHFGFMLTVRLLAFTPWPMGRTRKIFALARMNRVRDVARLTGMNRGDRETSSREAAVDMWRAIEMRDRTEQRRFDLVRAYIQRGADINFPNEDGSTLLHHFAAYVDSDFIKWLLTNHADPNIQDVRGNTPLHVACMSIYDGADIIRALLENPKTDACVYNCDGRSPLMLRLHKKKPTDALMPAISWEAIEIALSQPFPAHCLTALEKLVAASGPHSLRLPDHLFCISATISSDELERRRHQMWLKLLKPVTLEVCTVKELDEREKRVLQYVWAATEGPKQLREDARGAYREEIQDVFEEVAVHFAEEVLMSQPNTKAHKKYSLEEVEEIRAIAEENMHHGIFQQLPGWAITRDLLQAIKELERLRVLRFAEDLCDLLRCGRISCEQSHAELSMLNKSRYDVFTTRRQIQKTKKLKKVPTPRSSSKIAWDAEIGQLPQPSPKSQRSDDSLPSRTSSRISCNSNLSTLSTTSSNGDPRAASKRRKVPDASIDFWMGLVTVWLLALHLYARPSFLRRIRQIARPSEFVLGKPRDFEYVMKKARTRIQDLDLKAWRDKVLAPLYVTDILTCTFQVKTPERAREIEKELASMYAVVYSENCYDFDLEDQGVKHCHHEFVYLLESDFTELGHVAVFVQAKVLLVTGSTEHKLDIVRDVTAVGDLVLDEM